MQNRQMMEGYPYWQDRSQYYMGPPEWYSGPEPGELTEIFIKKLPSDTHIIELYELIRPLGTFYQIRLPITIEHESKGYGYVRFITKEDAKRAKDFLHGRIFKTNVLETHYSWDTREIQIHNWPIWLTQEESRIIIMTTLREVREVRTEPESDGVCNRGYVIVKFASHNAAAIARRDIKQGVVRHRLLPPGAMLTSVWTRGDFDIPEENFREVKCLYVNNIPPGTTQPHLLSLIHNALNQRAFVKHTYGERYGFIYFPDHESAAHALEKLRVSHIYISDQFLQFHWAKGPYARQRSTSTSESLPRENSPPQLWYMSHQQPMPRRPSVSLPRVQNQISLPRPSQAPQSMGQEVQRLPVRFNAGHFSGDNRDLSSGLFGAFPSPQTSASMAPGAFSIENSALSRSGASGMFSSRQSSANTMNPTLHRALQAQLATATMAQGNGFTSAQSRISMMAKNSPQSMHSVGQMPFGTSGGQRQNNGGLPFQTPQHSRDQFFGGDMMAPGPSRQSFPFTQIDTIPGEEAAGQQASALRGPLRALNQNGNHPGQLRVTNDTLPESQDSGLPDSDPSLFMYK